MTPVDALILLAAKAEHDDGQNEKNDGSDPALFTD